jgi:hypothetical protein
MAKEEMIPSSPTISGLATCHSLLYHGIVLNKLLLIRRLVFILGYMRLVRWMNEGVVQETVGMVGSMIVPCSTNDAAF